MSTTADIVHDEIAQDLARQEQTPETRPQADYDQDTDIRLIAALFERLDTRIAIDVGAEKGSFVRAFLERGANKVIAVEPHPGNAAALRELFAAQPAVQVLELALGARDETANLYIAEDKSGQGREAYHSLIAFDETPTIRRVGAIEVPCRTLDSLVCDGTIPAEIGALKIDAERSDFAIIQGMGRLFAGVVMLEYWDDLPETVGSAPYRVSDVRDWMQQLGYSNFALIKRTEEFELIQVNDAHTASGDWGNILFIHDRLAPQLMDLLFEAAAATQQRLVEQAKNFAHECRMRLEVIEGQQQQIEDLEHASSQQIVAIADPPETTPALIDILQRQSESTSALVKIFVRQTQILQHLEERLDKPGLTTKDSTGDLLDESLGLDEEGWLGRLRALDRRRVAAEAAADARLAVIDELQRALDHHRFWSWGARLQRSWSPKLGVLYQHAPHRVEIPPRYLQLPSLGADAPTISIVTPSLNQGEFIERTIRSVVEQHYPKLEYIVQDAASADDTPTILERYADSLTHTDSRPDKGFANGINMGFSHATGEILAYLNSDDVLLPGALHSVAQYFASNPDVDVVYGHRVVIDEYDAEIGRWVLPAHDNQVLSWADYVPQETLFWRRRIWERVGSAIDESFRFAIDWDLLLRFRDAGAKMQRMPRFLGAFRVHPHQKTSSNMQDVGFHEMNRLRERCHGRQVTSPEIHRGLEGYLRRHIVYHKLYRLGILRY
jgi:FkbM family methyltransferase